MNLAMFLKSVYRNEQYFYILSMKADKKSQQQSKVGVWEREGPRTRSTTAVGE